MTTDQADSIRAIIDQERASVAHYAALLKTETRKAWRARWRGLRRYHVLQIKRWREELTRD